MWVTIIASVLVVAMLVGPLMMLQPNTYQIRLARLRSLAMKQGLQVRMSQNPASGEPRQISVYSFRIPPEDIDTIKLKPWCLARQNLEHELNFVADWDWVGANRPKRDRRQALRGWLLELPAPFRAVEVEEHMVSLYWTEAKWHADEKWEDAAQKSTEFIEIKLKNLVQLLNEES